MLIGPDSLKVYNLSLISEQQPVTLEFHHILWPKYVCIHDKTVGLT